MSEQAQTPDKLAAWIAALEKLADDVENWSGQEQWLVHRDQKQITEELTGTYSAPVLTVQTNQGRIRIEPHALHVAGSSGRVDIYAWPSLDQVLLVDFEDGWRVYDQNQAEIISEWNKDAFVQLARNLAAVA